jgi:hypothetical protein
MQSLYRSDCLSPGGDDRLLCVEGAICCDVEGYEYSDLTCEEVDIRVPFDEPGWVQCPEGKFMRGLYQEDGLSELSDIQTMECCGVKGQWSWTTCSDVDAPVLSPARHLLLRTSIL